MPSTETVEGMQALLESMEALPLVVRKNLIVRALRKAGEIIAAAIRRLAPNDPATAGSRIADSVKVVVRDQTATGAYAEIGPSGRGFVGIFAEHGTKRQGATPFLGPAFDQAEQTAYEAFSEILGDGIEEEFYKRAS